MAIIDEKVVYCYNNIVGRGSAGDIFMEGKRGDAYGKKEWIRCMGW